MDAPPDIRAWIDDKMYVVYMLRTGNLFLSVFIYEELVVAL
jgi:hypothetical protein